MSLDTWLLVRQLLDWIRQESSRVLNKSNKNNNRLKHKPHKHRLHLPLLRLERKSVLLKQGSHNKKEKYPHNE
jgi:hypothetical protein